MLHRLLPTAAVAAIVAVPVFAADLAIEVRGVRSTDGRVYVAVHGPESKAEFPSGAGAVDRFRESARVGVIHLIARDLPPGRYAVNAFHDENGNGELDTNLVGVPSEGYGFANDPTIRFGPPDFEAAAVTVGERSEVAVLTLNY